MGDPLVSIIMRSFNEAWALRETLPALQAQEYENWELIVIDSGSTDGSQELIRGSQPRHFIQISPHEYNPAWVMNRGMQLARSELGIFLNADATPQNPNWLRPLVDALQAPEVAAVFGRQMRHVPEGEGLEQKRRTEHETHVDRAGHAPGDRHDQQRDESARSHRETVVRFLRSVVETIRFVKTDPKKTTEILAKYYRDKDEAASKRRYDALNGLHPEYPYVVPGAVQSIIDVLEEDGKIKDAAPAQSFLDMSYLHAIEREGPGAAIK